MRPTTATGDVFDLDPAQLDALCGWAESEGFVPSPPLAEGELGRMVLGAETIVVHQDGRIVASGDERARAGWRLLMVCAE